MDLLAYIREVGTDHARDVAGEAGTKYVYLSQIAHGHRRPSPMLALAIEKATNGRVCRSDLRPDIYPDPHWLPPDLSQNRESSPEPQPEPKCCKED